MSPAEERARSAFDPRVLDTGGRVVYFPVRHHSPACARVVRELALTLRPPLVLIEGPSDFNDRMHELDLPHRLPIAIYSYSQLGDGRRRGAFYPFSEHSPEWQALCAARELGAPARFIDLPWARILELAAGLGEPPQHRYADAELRRSGYVEALCRRLGLDPDFDTLWDTLFEIDDGLGAVEFMERCHRFCHSLRAFDSGVPPEDEPREAHMAGHILSALAERPDGPILVVTGGYHSHALHQRVAAGRAGPAAEPPRGMSEGSVSGIALTPYSYARLDGLAGYEAGMPHPGFYDRVWRAAATGEGGAHRELLGRVAETVRERGQQASAADLIAVEATAEGLAALRGHARVWRQDLVDGIIGALVKEELAEGVPHPFLGAVYEALRGDARGALAAGAEQPPLV
jgi:hypothetical protein